MSRSPSTPTVSPNIAADANAVWLVTGCSSGFGKALATRLHAEGRCVVATARRPESLSFLPDREPKVLKVALDVTKPATIHSAVSTTIRTFGRLDVVINNAGIGVIGPTEDVTDEQTRHQFEVNVFGVFNVVRAVAPQFRTQRSGMFINFSSMAGQSSFLSLGVYSASKFSVEGISEALRAEMAPYGVRVMIVEPGPFDTEWLGKNAIWSPKTGSYQEVWDFVKQMQVMYANRQVVGDPAKAAQAIISSAQLDNPPFRLALHAISEESTRKKLAEVTADLNRMSGVTQAVHFSS
jgi:NAD(P)-dependent dehydrogenase (short-subunit alcohol dehydrogenase family)